MSFEHYPFPPCEIVWADLFREPEIVSHILDVWRQDGLPANVPMMNTESNVTYGNAQQMAISSPRSGCADSVGAFLTAGGAVYYHSPIQPEPLRSRMPRLWHVWQLRRRRESQRENVHLPISRQPPD